MCLEGQVWGGVGGGGRREVYWWVTPPTNMYSYLKMVGGGKKIVKAKLWNCDLSMSNYEIAISLCQQWTKKTLTLCAVGMEKEGDNMILKPTIWKQQWLLCTIKRRWKYFRHWGGEKRKGQDPYRAQLREQDRFEFPVFTQGGINVLRKVHTRSGLSLSNPPKVARNSVYPRHEKSRTTQTSYVDQVWVFS